jgi:hypothetical protein
MLGLIRSGERTRRDRQSGRSVVRGQAARSSYVIALRAAQPRTGAPRLLSVFKPIEDVLDHFILKFDKTVFAAPPFVDFVLRRFVGLHYNPYPQWV